MCDMPSFFSDKSGNFIPASCLEWKSDQGSAQGWKFLKDFGMEGNLRHDYSCYLLDFCRAYVHFSINQYIDEWLLSYVHR
jgi:hypothetical protein